MQRAFTLVELLAATTLAATITVFSAGWLLSLQRSAGNLQRQALETRCALIIATQVHRDLVYSTPEGATDSSRIETLVNGPNASARRRIRWHISDGNAIRSHRDPNGSIWTSDIISHGIDDLTAKPDAQGRTWLHIAAGTYVIDLPLFPMGRNVP